MLQFSTLATTLLDYFNFPKNFLEQKDLYV